ALANTSTPSSGLPSADSTRPTTTNFVCFASASSNASRGSAGCLSATFFSGGFSGMRLFWIASGTSALSSTPFFGGFSGMGLSWAASSTAAEATASPSATARRAAGPREGGIALRASWGSSEAAGARFPERRRGRGGRGGRSGGGGPPGAGAPPARRAPRRAAGRPAARRGRGAGAPAGAGPRRPAQPRGRLGLRQPVEPAEDDRGVVPLGQ